MAHHQLFEWEGRGFDAFPVAEAERLARAAAAPAARLTGGQRAFDLGRDRIAARNLVGMVVAGGTSCEILPKIDRDAAGGHEGGGHAAGIRRQLIGMLAVAHDLPIADDTATSIDTQSHSLLEILIARFVAMLGDAVRRGIPRFYVGHAQDLPALRGRLDVRRQFSALAADPSRLACRYDDFSDDIALNQVMKAAVTRLRGLARSHANQRRLGEMALLYADVAAVPAPALRWDRIVPDRTNARWQALLRLARLILGDRFQNSAHGSADGFALLFDMNVLFERYVARLIAPIAAERGWHLKAQGGRRACLTPEGGGEGLFRTEPDLRLVGQGGTGMVLDTKWKRLVDRARDPRMDVEQGDIYQLMAYARLYACGHVVLLYPRHPGLTTPLPAHFTVDGAGDAIRLSIAAIDLSRHDAARADLAALIATAQRRAAIHQVPDR